MFNKIKYAKKTQDINLGHIGKNKTFILKISQYYINKPLILYNPRRHTLRISELSARPAYSSTGLHLFSH